MPQAVEQNLMRAAHQMANKGKLKKKKKGESLLDASKRFTYATLTNMQRKGQVVPWRKLKRGPSI